MSKLVPLLSLLLVLSACGSADSPPTMCVPPVEDAPVRGADPAWVTIVEYGDFECPYCGQASQTIADIESAYPDDVRLVFKHFPLPQHEYARPAAIAAACAQEQWLFWPMYEALFAHQDALTESDLISYATDAGVDLDAWNTCRQDGTGAAHLARDEREAELLGVGGTPTFFVNGKVIAGAYPYATFAAAVEDAKATAQEGRTSAAGYYDELVAGGCSAVR